MGLPGWGTAVGKAFSWLPGPRQSKLNQIDKLTRENEKLQKGNFNPSDSAKYVANTDRIKQLRQELERID